MVARDDVPSSNTLSDSVERGELAQHYQKVYLSWEHRLRLGEWQPLYPNTHSQGNPPGKGVRTIAIRHFHKRPTGTSQSSVYLFADDTKINSDVLAHQETEKFFKLIWIACGTGCLIGSYHSTKRNTK